MPRPSVGFIDWLTGRGDGVPLDWRILLIITAGCLSAWALSYWASRIVPLRSASRPMRIGDRRSLLSRLRVDETIAGILTVSMLIALAISIDAVLRMGEVLVMSTSGLIAVAATPMLVGLIEGVHVPGATARADRAMESNIDQPPREHARESRLAA